MALVALVSPYTTLVPVSTGGGNGITIADDGNFSLSSDREWFYATDDVPVDSMVRVAPGEVAHFQRNGTTLTRYLRTRSGGAALTVTFAALESLVPGAEVPEPVTTDADGNLAIGDGALALLSGGENNIALGIGALAHVTSGRGNIGLGNSALYAMTTAYDSVGIGRNALVGATGGQNVAYGSYAGSEILAGTNNVLLGYHAGQGLGDLSNWLVVGSVDAPIDSVYIKPLASGVNWQNNNNFHGKTIIGSLSAFPDDADFFLRSLAFKVDQGTDTLTIRVKYSDGTFGTIDLAVVKD